MLHSIQSTVSVVDFLVRTPDSLDLYRSQRRIAAQLIAGMPHSSRLVQNFVVQ